MKLTFKLSFLAMLIMSLFTITSCEDNLETSCDDFSANISYEIVDSSYVILTANPEGGEAPITYEWNTGETTQSINVTEEAVYSVTLTDATDCTASLDFTVQDTTNNSGCQPIQVSINVDDTNPAAVVLTASSGGGVAPYNYVWNNGNVGEELIVTSEGTYVVTSTDADGCTGIASYTMTADSTPCSNFYGELLVDYNPGGVGTITASVTGGNVGYTYAWNTGETTQSIMVTENGTYTVVVTDAEGCELIMSTEFDPSSCNNFLVEIVAFQDSTSSLQILSVNSLNGSTIASYDWSTGETAASIQVAPQGTFGVTVVNVEGCVAEDEITL